MKVTALYAKVQCRPIRCVLYIKRDDIRYAPGPVLVGTCRRICLWTSKMFTQITNLDSILYTPTCCERKQEIDPTVDSQLGAHIPILRIRIHMGGLIRATDLRCTLVSNLFCFSFFYFLFFARWFGHKLMDAKTTWWCTSGQFCKCWCSSAAITFLQEYSSC
jgi:hypothetical protein